ncbi:TRAP-type C4-dicarboxylate transport system permease small subunit [Rhizobium sp. SJZ105]|uniref:TRAP transporter small permease n=1 Tax=Rhizobium sp. SJZ105 TaxID=2572678 RepID=UPI0011AC37B1|nr:TRAP transporter small permease [Rhizobium sp. SJZ105]TWC76372.1 TRAP-type C4-dicarboxylate transport system permease small subunit [Rhizobium sp. SJZ105]
MPPPDATDPFFIRAMHNIAAIGLCLMMLVVVLDVFLRSIFNAPLPGSYDLVGFFLLIMTMAGLGVVVAKKAEVLVDLVDAVLAPTVIKLLSVVSAILGILAFGFFAWAMVDPAIGSWRWGEKSLELGVPKWPLYVIAFLGIVGVVFGYTVQLRAALRPDAETETPVRSIQ